MVVSSISKYEIVKYIRSSKAHFSKKKHGAKTRPGVYGKNLDDAIKRLADKLSAKIDIVQMHVLRLVNEGVVKFVKNRLVVTQDKADTVVRSTKRPSLTLITTMITEGVDSRDNDADLHDITKQYPDVPAWRLRAWPECYPPQSTVA